MMLHKHERPDFQFERPRKVARLKQCNKANKRLRRYYAGIRHRTFAPAPAPAAAA